MSKIHGITDALDNASLLLIRKNYQAPKKINEISRILLAQALVWELRNRYKLTFVKIGNGVGVDEKTVRYDWLEANHCIEPQNLVALVRFYLKMRGVL